MSERRLAGQSYVKNDVSTCLRQRSKHGLCERLPVKKSAAIDQHKKLIT